MYTALRTDIAPRTDAAPCKIWDAAPKTACFADMATGRPALYDTEASLLWDNEFLYIRFWVEEPYPVATQTQRDSLIFKENDVEVFIDGGDCYYEFEISALGTVYEVFFIWRDAFGRGTRFDVPEFDLYDREAYTFGGNYDRTNDHFWRGTHPRGVRWAFLDWDFPGLIAATRVIGTLNDPSVRSEGWVADIALPWSGMTHLANGRSLPPQNGDEWNIFLGRFQIVNIGDKQEQAGWCENPHGVYDTHMPEKFSRVRFSTEAL